MLVVVVVMCPLDLNVVLVLFLSLVLVCKTAACIHKVLKPPGGGCSTQVLTPTCAREAEKVLQPPFSAVISFVCWQGCLEKAFCMRDFVKRLQMRFKLKKKAHYNHICVVTC